MTRIAGLLRQSLQTGASAIQKLFQSIAGYGIHSDELRHPRLRIVIDPANLISQGCNQKRVLDEAFALLGDSIVIAHAKDRNSEFQACAAGKGVLDFEYYLRCAKQSGFTGPLVMHGLDEKDVAFSREFLRKAMADVGFIS